MTRPLTTPLAAAALLALAGTHAHAADLRGPAPAQGDAYEYLITAEPTERGRHIVEFGVGEANEGTVETDVRVRLRYDIDAVDRGTVVAGTITYVENRNESEYRVGGQSLEEVTGEELNGMSLTYEVKDGYWVCDADSTAPLLEDFKDIMENSGFYDPRLLYPAGDTAPETTWAVEGDALNAFPGIVGFPGAQVRGEGEFKFLGVEEIGGEPFAVIAFVVDAAIEVQAVMQNTSTVITNRNQYEGYIYRNLNTYLDVVVMEGTTTFAQRFIMPGGSSTNTRIEPRTVRIEQSVPNNGNRQRRPGPVIEDTENDNTDPTPNRPQTDPRRPRPAPVPAPAPQTDDNAAPEPAPQPAPTPRPAPRPAPRPE